MNWALHSVHPGLRSNKKFRTKAPHRYTEPRFMYQNGCHAYDVRTVLTAEETDDQLHIVERQAQPCLGDTESS